MLTCSSVITRRLTLTARAPPLYSGSSTVTPLVSWGRGRRAQGGERGRARPAFRQSAFVGPSSRHARLSISWRASRLGYLSRLVVFHRERYAGASAWRVRGSGGGFHCPGGYIAIPPRPPSSKNTPGCFSRSVPPVLSRRIHALEHPSMKPLDSSSTSRESLSAKIDHSCCLAVLQETRGRGNECPRQPRAGGKPAGKRAWVAS